MLDCQPSLCSEKSFALVALAQEQVHTAESLLIKELEKKWLRPKKS